MSYEKFTTSLLNIKPSDVLSVLPMNQKDGSIILKVRLVPREIPCPICGIPGKVHGYYRRKLTHSALANRVCIICYEQRRYICPDCGTTFAEKNPFIDSGERLTFETKYNVLKDLKYTEETYTSVAQRYNLTPTKVMRLFDKHVDIARKPMPRILSIDEHHFPNSDHDSKYCCLFMDFESGEMVDIISSRKKFKLVEYFSEIKHSTMDPKTMKSELDNVEYVSIDMYDTYRDIASIFFPKAKVCADSFHVLKHLTDDFRRIRMRVIRNTQDPTLKYLLTKFRHVFDHNKKLDNEPRYNKRLGRYVNLREIKDFLCSSFEELKTAYELKEYYIKLNGSKTYENAAKAIDEAIALFESSGIEEYEEFFNMLGNWREEIINSFITVNGRRINNSYMESKNRLVGKLIFNANGYRNFKRTRNRILYCLNEKDTFKL